MRSMTTANNSENNLNPWQQGQSGNPSGRPKGTRDLAGDAEVHFLENQVTDRQADVHAIFKFPDKESALAWRNSEQYKAILPHRTDNTTNTYFAIVDGLGD
jgi:uncharacterized protein (DUF1330 family)